ncbi:MAG: YqaE/Pmp3 family membrane protein [Planctomycetota bacterium]
MVRGILRMQFSEEFVMRYFFAIILPPLAVLLCGKPLQFILNIFLTLFFWIPGVIHAILVVNSHLADKRTDRIIRAAKKAKSS